MAKKLTPATTAKSAPPPGVKGGVRVGAHSKARQLAHVDGRTLAGRVLRRTRADLTQHLGGHPSAAQKLLIESAAIKSVRLFLVSSRILDAGDVGIDDGNHVMAWLNSLRLDLVALGLEARAKDVTPDLSSIIKEHAESQRQPAALSDAEAAE